MNAPRWMIVNVLPAAGGTERAAARRADGVCVRLPDPLDGSTVLELLRGWADWAPLLLAWDAVEAEPMPIAGLLAPLTSPPKILLAAGNYADHLAEVDLEPVAGARPYFSVKTANTVVGHEQAVVVPRGVECLDWEAELAVVIGRPGRDVPAARARAHVAGYTIVNDMAARERFNRSDGVIPALNYDWLSARCADTLLPMGPGITPSWMVAEPHDLEIELRVNDVVKQHGSTRGMTASIDELVAAASGIMTLAPGDVIATGTPAGVGLATEEFLAPGDRVTISVTGLGTLRNDVVGP